MILWELLRHLATSRLGIGQRTRHYYYGKNHSLRMEEERTALDLFLDTLCRGLSEL